MWHLYWLHFLIDQSPLFRRLFIKVNKMSLSCKNISSRINTNSMWLTKVEFCWEMVEIVVDWFKRPWVLVFVVFISTKSDYIFTADSPWVVTWRIAYQIKQIDTQLDFVYNDSKITLNTPIYFGNGPIFIKSIFYSPFFAASCKVSVVFCPLHTLYLLNKIVSKRKMLAKADDIFVDG